MAKCGALNSHLIASAVETLASSEGGGYRAIRQRKASGGTRILHEPCDEAKLVQASLLPFLYRWPTDNRMFGFQPQRSPVDNARYHLQVPDRNNPKKVFGFRVPHWTLTIDLKDFFPSVTDKLLEQMYRQMFSQNRLKGYRGLKESEVGPVYEEFIRLMLLLTAFHGRLPQGAPTSPYLANLALCFTGVVKRIEALCRSRKTREPFRFSIYADDITISSHKDKISDRFIRELVTAVEESGWFKVNPAKIRRNSQKYKAHKITGVVLTTDSKGEPKLTLPQRTLKSLRGRIHRVRISLEQPSAHLTFSDLDQVLGNIAWIKSVYGGFDLSPSVRGEISAFEEAWKNYRNQKRAEYNRHLKALAEFLRLFVYRSAQNN